ncbi:MAG: insulinase family protein [Phascolarctobacterium sp.]|nr:insulinase family protein [Phascolarctobacterium sp.]
MKLTVNNICHGFKVLTYDFVKEVDSDVYLLEHLQSGARLLYLSNDDDNKVFSISFRTPPADDTGIPHILEHSSLCGSRKYQLKEPFVELVKGSLNTFLNAMTYPDKTVYPVASRNDKDFLNLVDVYLDAVFFPLIYRNKFTLRQEGWHYHIDNAEGKLSYNGVVYNEMKGVYSTADALLSNEALKALFPDTPYRFESGGYPDAIPQLTQEAFENFHKTYYRPENSYIYLYGNMDIEYYLDYLDSEYLADFKKTCMAHSEIPMQVPLKKTKEIKAYYPVAKNEDCGAKTYHELSAVTGTATDVKTSMALRLLEGILLESESSPLRRALLREGVGQNISGSYSGEILQPIFSIRASGSDFDMRDKFVSVIYNTLQKITIEGLDKKLLTAALNSMEFKLREADFGVYPKGLIYNLSVMNNWLYGGNPVEGLRYNEILQELRDGINTHYYENLIENYLLDNTHKVLVSLLPEPGKEEADRKAEAKKMATLKESMSKEKLQQYIDECAELNRLQAQPDSEEALSSIPILQRGDIRREIEKIPVKEKLSCSNTLLYVPAATNKIDYLNWYFDITSVERSLLLYCYLLLDLLGKFNTERYTYEEIATESIMYTGGVSFDVRAMSEAENDEKYRIYFSVKGKVLHENLPKLLDILQAVALESKLDDEKRFKELLAEIKTDLDSNFFAKGQAIAISRLYSYCSASGRVNEQAQFSYYQFIKMLTENFDREKEKALDVLRRLLQVFFHKNRYVLVYSCDEDLREKVADAAQSFASRLPVAELNYTVEDLPAPGNNEGITTAGKVQYVVAGGNFRRHGHHYKGAMRVLETVLRYEYLWTKIRIQGGAYGATACFNTNGTGVFASYRDPRLSESLTAYRELPEWLGTLNFSLRELDKYVIGTISGMDRPLTNSMRLEEAAAAYLRNVDDELKQKIRDEVLNVTNEDLQELAVIIRDMLSDGYICVVGGKEQIMDNENLFDKVIDV